MLHHISFPCVDLERSRKFYTEIFRALGYVEVWSKETAVGFGVEGGVDIFCLKLKDKVNQPGPGFHVAFTARSTTAVDEFHRRACEFGGTDQGSPGLRPHYGPNYYAAFVLDPDAHLIEAVCIREGQQ